jgi:DNA-binding NtrC family response regulator
MTVPDEADVLLAARTDACVLLTGTGPARTVAERIHSRSGWNAGTFEIVDCGAPADVLDSRLFGVLESDVYPAVSDPPRARRRQIGTLFLQDVGRLDDVSQARLLDLLDTGRRGPYRLRRRIVAATPECLLPRVDAGTFNGTLYYRLNVLHFVVPANGAPGSA